MALPIIVSPSPLAGVSGSPFGPVNVVTMTASQAISLARGWWYVTCTANDSVTWKQTGSTTVTVVAKSGAGWTFSDGTNVTLLNDGTADSAVSSTYTQLLGT